MDALLRDYLPTAPDLGLYVAPDLPAAKLRAALPDYASLLPGATMPRYASAPATDHTALSPVPERMRLSTTIDLDNGNARTTLEER